MEKEKIIGTLNMLKEYVNENWDTEYKNDIDDVNEAVDYAVAAIQDGENVGIMELNGKKYKITEME